MVLASKYNIALARMAYLVISSARRLHGKGDEARVRRGGLNWILDLREGLDLTIFVTGYFQRAVVEACQRLLTTGSIAIDVGANMGSQTLHMAQRVGPTGKVVAVEPTSYPLERLLRNLGANPDLRCRVSAVQAFLVSGNADRSAQIPDTLPSSWRVAGDRRNPHPIHRGVPQPTAGASAMTLDELIDKENLSRVDLIKLDVDGAEDEVLAGGEQTIRTFKPWIIMEVAPYTLEERGLPGDAPLQRLWRLGYRFESLNGVPLESEERRWVRRLRAGYGRDVIARPAQEGTHNER